MANGVLIIDKPRDWTSHDVVAKLRGILREKRVGHGGTLDPMATGVLPVFAGRATRAVELVTEGEKEYEAELLLGVSTDTQDVTGRVLERRRVTVGREDVEEVLPRFTGDILQVPPMYSALKRDGKKLYELARKGVEVEREPRPVTIRGLTLEGEALREEGPVYRLRVVCSKGTYVRTLCHDIGEALGCGGTMAALRRVRVGAFSLEGAVTMETLMEAEEPAALLRPVDSCFADPRVTVRGEALRRAKNGNPFPLEAAAGTYRVYGPEGEFLLLGQCDGRVCTTIKSFFEV